MELAIRRNLSAGRDALNACLAGKTASSRSSYQADADAYGRFERGGLDALLSARERAERSASEWQQAMLNTGLSPATINRRLAFIRSLVRSARRVGLIDWAFEGPKSVRSKQYRETAGPGWEKIKAALVYEGDDEREIRNRAIIALLYAGGLRVSELTALKIEDVDFDAVRVKVVGKGFREASWCEISGLALPFLDRWIKHPRRPASDTLFDVTRRTVWNIIAGAGLGHPHGIRHTAITDVARISSGNIVQTAAFSRHKNLNTVKIYLDNIEESARKAADLLNR